jgi:hypothetical protein
MSNTVYDTTVVAYANGALVGRSPGNALDRRLRAIEDFVNGERVAWYNERLLAEYIAALVDYRNDVIELFVTRLSDYGRKANRSTLSRQNHSRAQDLRWPDHDQHLLAAAIEAPRPTILVTEDNLHRCSSEVKRVFRVRVQQV